MYPTNSRKSSCPSRLTAASAPAAGRSAARNADAASRGDTNAGTTPKSSAMDAASARDKRSTLTSAGSRSTPNAPSRLAYSRKSVRRGPVLGGALASTKTGAPRPPRWSPACARASNCAETSMDLAGGGTGTPDARGGAWGRQSRSETNARREASRTRDSKRSYRSEPAVSGWRMDVAAGPTSVGRQPTRARAVRACAKSTSWRRGRGGEGRMGRQGGRGGDVGRDGRRTRRASDDERGERE